MTIKIRMKCNKLFDIKNLHEQFEYAGKLDGANHEIYPFSAQMLAELDSLIVSLIAPTF